MKPIRHVRRHAEDTRHGDWVWGLAECEGRCAPGDRGRSEEQSVKAFRTLPHCREGEHFCLLEHVVVRGCVRFAQKSRKNVYKGREWWDRLLGQFVFGAFVRTDVSGTCGCRRLFVSCAVCVPTASVFRAGHAFQFWCGCALACPLPHTHLACMLGCLLSPKRTSVQRGSPRRCSARPQVKVRHRLLLLHMRDTLGSSPRASGATVWTVWGQCVHSCEEHHGGGFFFLCLGIVLSFRARHMLRRS